MSHKVLYSTGIARLASAAAVIVLLAVCGVSYAITNGQPDGDAHPYVGLVVCDQGGTPTWRSTGFLISPTVFVTAGHVTDGADGARVWLDADLTGNAEYPYGGSTSIEGTPHTHPDFCVGCAKGLPGFDTHDVGVIVLDEPVYLDEYAELPTLGLVETLAMMTDVDLVGYGMQSQLHGGGQPVWTGERIRQFAPSEIVASEHVTSDEFIKLTANPGRGTGGATYGDSGGPVLLSGTDTVVAIMSFPTNYNAAGVTYANRADYAAVLDWINGFQD
jgi:hypothetical protein